jgi:hypothetical protein
MQVNRLITNLVAFSNTLNELPTTRLLTMKMLYYDVREQSDAPWWHPASASAAAATAARRCSSVVFGGAAALSPLQLPSPLSTSHDLNPTLAHHTYSCSSHPKHLANTWSCAG